MPREAAGTRSAKNKPGVVKREEDSEEGIGSFSGAAAAGAMRLSFSCITLRQLVALVPLVGVDGDGRQAFHDSCARSPSLPTVPYRNITVAQT